jgi:hypothetical protein
MSQPEIDVVRLANFDWTTRLASVWEDPAWDVPNLHEEIRSRFVSKLEDLTKAAGFASPLGWVINGTGGTGKTHLLGAFRREAVRRKAAFVLVDMTDVRDFWATVLLGYIGSLQVRYDGELFQYQFILRNLIEQQLQSRANKPAAEILEILAKNKSTHLAKDVKKVLEALHKIHPAEIVKYHNTIRSMICWNSDDFTIASTGAAWLQGQEIPPEDCTALGFTVAREEPRRIVEALSWIMSLSGPTVLAFDQLDPIVTELAFQRASETSSEEHNRAEAIITHLGSGLGALRDVTRKTLVVVSCVESTWHTLRETVLNTFLDRFMQPPETLGMTQHRDIAEAVVRNRLAQAYQVVGFQPRYPTWPFLPAAFGELTHSTPREVLKKCEAYRQRWLHQGSVEETQSFNPPDSNVQPVRDLHHLDEAFTEQKAAANTVAMIEVGHEDEQLAPLLRTALHCLLWEHDLPDDVDAQVDEHFTGGSKTQPLHARLRLVFLSEKSREEHYCLRAMQATNARAYQSRLSAAMVESGIDHSLKFRHLGIVRTTPPPGGSVTQKLTGQFTEAGGSFLGVNEDALRVLHAIFQMKLQGDPDLKVWLRSRKPLSALELIRHAVPSALLFGQRRPASPSVPTQAGGDPASATSIHHGNATALQTETPTNGQAAQHIDPVTARAAETPVVSTTRRDAPTQASPPMIPLGRRLIGLEPHAVLSMPVTWLEKHAIVVAGAGSGKTVLLKRLIEEAALLGVPSIVIDGANDLAALDEAWPSPPASWEPDDHETAKRFHRSVDVVTWTPGKESGNPVALEPLPDLAAVADDAEEYDAAVAMAVAALAPMVASGKSAAARKSHGLLSSSLRYFGKTMTGSSLGHYIDMLADLPPDAGLDLGNEAKLAKQMSDSLKVAVETNPLLRSQGTPLDPALLFGDDLPGDCTRISVISLIGLQGQESARHFLNALAMTLFSWIKKHPDPHPRPLRGLLVIDEARDYVPAMQASACKESLTRLVAQARKYHLGIVFATQNPKDIETKIVANCSTQYYGKVNSPAAIDAVRDMIRLKGGTGDDIARLACGQFYVHNADLEMTAPEQVTIPLCLSYHPTNPLDETAVLAKAGRSRQKRLPRMSR